MIKAIKNIIWKLFATIDSCLKFPNLKTGEIGIQLGVDMSSSITSDFFSMYSRVKSKGKVYGIEPDIRNVSIARKTIDEKGYSMEIIHKAVFSEKGKVEMAFGELASWNQLTNIPIDSTVSFNGTRSLVPMDTLENIIYDNNIDYRKIGHINFTINGAEYYALLGMKSLLKKIDNVNLSIVAGRYDESGDINGVPDYKMIIELLKELGFTYRFKRIHQLFWWGFVTKLILNRKWVYNKDNYGVILASKGNKKLKWYQSFS